MPDVYLSVGSNHNADANLPKGIDLLRERVTVVRASSVYESAAADGVDAAPYLNAALVLQTDLPPEVLKSILIEVENACGRMRRDAQGNKSKVVTLDFDIVLYGDAPTTYQYGEKTYHLPHADISQYAHVAIPLAEVAPDAIHPMTQHTFAQMASQFDATTLHKRTHIHLAK